ncbi:MAG: phenylacetic acid degradation bifunctional protein PaaZ [Candidatus Eremiobacteraeota bacterium]|nr:phenylacetic acid degradation bifunctional protein PaaZ [Candidatus Eremiobacteraeota bacterium]MBC5802215.1 phenylacetic acid degradation bifunctional protein PaaZ [Candidatus Eremiobacteraeota bacterium]MBC5821255.1 phenylacetic acid degradation bifunctional protein PaaZ [Candidatus Eremiobacteraeota bacterium]
MPSFAQGRWIAGDGEPTPLPSAIDGRTVAAASSRGLDFAGMLAHARRVGGPALRALTFHQRAAMLKALALYLNERREPLYALSFETGATKRDHFFDIDGGIGALFAYASRGRRELPDERFALDGAHEQLSKGGTFVGRHVMTPLRGVAVHINAYNFPCWGMLEKLAPALLAGVPAIVKPATATSYLTQAMFEMIVASGILPDGAVQLIVGGTGDLLDHLGGQDVVSFTGSLATSLTLRDHPALGRNAVRFVAERDSLNAAVLGTDAGPGTPEFDLFITEVMREMTSKAGQKCTAIRRALVPRAYYDAAAEALQKKLGGVVVGDPRRDDVRMGALASMGQRDAVRAAVAILRGETEAICGDPEHVELRGADADLGAFLAPLLLGCERPLRATKIHEVEAFGPVSTLMAYDGIDEAIELAARGDGSLCASVYTYDGDVASELILGLGAYHGRIVAIDRDCAKESTGHGSPLPGLVHGGPGRAGGGEEMGGLRGVFHYMQRTAVQGSPTRLAALTHTWTRGAAETKQDAHPFRRPYDDLAVGETVHTAPRTITLEDIEHFAAFTGDQFYAHMNEEAARANPFFPGRVAHGYLVLAFAAGLFVEPSPGPVLANYGLDNLRFTKPVEPGDTIRVRLTVKSKTPRKPEYGEVRWDVEVTNQHDDIVAAYDLLTLNAYRSEPSSDGSSPSELTVAQGR